MHDVKRSGEIIYLTDSDYMSDLGLCYGLYCTVIVLYFTVISSLFFWIICIDLKDDIIKLR